MLSVRDLETSFPVRRHPFARQLLRRTVVAGVSLDIPRGRTLGLVGESGCGKTTLARSILRLVEPSGGRVTLLGREVLAATRAELRELRADMQMIFQDPFGSLNERMTVGRIIEEPLIIHGSRSAKSRWTSVEELLERVGLSLSVAHRYPHEFSGGQRQRIAIARAIALEPALVICDEPVSALDVSVQSQILALLGRLQESSGMSYLFISHDLAVVRYVSHQVAVMYMGKIVEFGETSALFDDPRHPYTLALLAAAPKPARVSARRSIEPAIDLGPLPDLTVGCAFHPRCPLASEVCRNQAPPMTAWSSDGPVHHVACHHADKVVGEAASPPAA